MCKYGLYLLLLIPLSQCLDGIIFTTIAVHMDTPLNCSETALDIDMALHQPNCTLDALNTTLFLTYPGTHTPVKNDNITFVLYIGPPKGQTTNYTGVLVTDRNFPNTLKITTLTLTSNITVTTLAPTTTTTTTITTKPTGNTKSAESENAETVAHYEAHLTIHYLYLKTDGPTKVTKNGSAVTVAVIEGLVLIAILVYFGYQTMVVQKRKQTANLYGYDNNAPSRITVPDSIRMSDIPPPRDTTYAMPPTPSVIPPTAQRTIVASPDLVVPSSSANTTTATNHTSPQNPPPSAQFNDPFASLDSW